MLDGYVWATAADVVRLAQKDTEYVKELCSRMEESVRMILPARLWNDAAAALLAAVGRVVYYGGIVVSGKQSLGEEYCDVFEVESGSDEMYAPSQMSRAVMALFHMLGSRAAKLVLRATARSYGLAWREDALNALVSWLERAHLALFYLGGRFYELPKRIAGVQYVRVAAVRRLNPRYKVLGILLSIQVVVSAAVQLREFAPRRKTRTLSRSSKRPVLERIDAPLDEEEAETLASLEVPGADAGKKCSLCLSTLKDPALTECGHVFCWDCIFEWCSTQDVCPLCRQSIQLRGLLHLNHYG